ncbi:hypothetical protein [Pseudarthrobacter sp. NKDBFgelt]|uniref:hypothetical protein n=1 Tax=Pseudarthrobacter sp. NKDBFgelt TaxID=3384443 RepID=UPI0038D4F05D
MKAENPSTAAGEVRPLSDGARPDLSNATVREDLAGQGRCALVHLPTGRTCLLPLRHHGACEFHRPQEADDVAAGG